MNLPQLNKYKGIEAVVIWQLYKDLQGDIGYIFNNCSRFEILAHDLDIYAYRLFHFPGCENSAIMDGKWYRTEMEDELDVEGKKWLKILCLDFPELAPIS